MAADSRFDIFVRRNQRWQHAGKYRFDQRDEAVTQAQSIDAEGDNDGVRVIRVTAYGTRRAPTETIEWITPGITKVASRSDLSARRKKGGGAQNGVETLSSTTTTMQRRGRNGETSRGTTKTPPSNPVPLILKCLAIIAVSALIPLVLTHPIAQLSHYLVAILFNLPQDIVALTVFGLSLVCFLITATLAAKIFIHTQDLIKAFPNRYGPPPPPARNERYQSRKSRIPDRTETDPDPATKKGAATGDTSPPSLDGMDKAADASSGSAQSLTDNNRKTILKFLERSLTALADDIERLDQYTVFGINLFLGGAADRLAQTLDLTAMQKFVLIRESISALGTQPEMIEVFCEKFDAYNTDVKYRILTDLGRQVMDKHLNNDPDCFKNLPEVMRRWRRSGSAIAQAQGIIIIMFTDLVGSTQMTHDRGDLGAQDIVRVHNAIVRTALAEYHGEEVKHTGDGIMASFANPISAIRAAVRIQNELAAHNQKNPTHPVNVRIGLNAGDAVREEDDFFGQTVQLAARICDKAGTGEILITRALNTLCGDHTFTLTEAGPFELKGIDQPVTAYTVATESG